MDIKLSRTEINGKPTATNLTKIVDELKDGADKFFYIDRDTSHKDVLTLSDKLEAKGYSVYIREIKFGLNEKDYLYEMHVL